MLLSLVCGSNAYSLVLYFISMYVHYIYLFLWWKFRNKPFIDFDEFNYEKITRHKCFHTRHTFKNPLKLRVNVELRLIFSTPVKRTVFAHTLHFCNLVRVKLWKERVVCAHLYHGKVSILFHAIPRWMRIFF